MTIEIGLGFSEEYGQVDFYYGKQVDTFVCGLLVEDLVLLEEALHDLHARVADLADQAIEAAEDDQATCWSHDSSLDEDLWSEGEEWT